MDEQLRLALLKANKINADLSLELEISIRRFKSLQKDFQEISRVIKKCIEEDKL
ncbi:MAG: hypothetical protein ACRDA4_08190 [Filifactoraceae bacterium]